MGAIKALFALIEKFLKQLFRIFFNTKESARGEFKFMGLKGPRSFTIMLFVLGMIFVAALSFTVLVKKDVLAPVETLLPHEIPPGANATSDNIEKAGEYKIEGDLANLSKALSSPDCDRIFEMVRSGQRITSDERKAFEICKSKLTPAQAAIYDKIIAGVIPPELADTLLAKAEDPAAAENILKALEDENVLEALRGSTAKDTANILEDLGKLSAKERELALKTLESVPETYRGEAVKSIQNIAAVKDPAARESLLGTLSKAKSPAQIQEVTEFAKVLEKATPDEQKRLAEAFAKVDPRARRAFIDTTKDVLELPEGSALRTSLVQGLEKSAELPYEEQMKALNSLQAIAKDGRDLPEAVQAEVAKKVKTALDTAKPAEKLGELSQRVSNISKINKNSPLEAEKMIQALSGEDKSLNTKLEKAAKLIDVGQGALAKSYVEGAVEEKDVDSVLSQQAQKGGAGSTNASPAELQRRIAELKELESGVKETEKEITRLLQAGVPPSDGRVVRLYEKLSGLRNQRDALTIEVEDMKKALRDRLDKMRAQYGAELSDYGIQLPDFSYEFDEAAAKAGRPSARLGNLRQVPEFWGDRKNISEATLKELERRFGKEKAAEIVASGKLPADEKANSKRALRINPNSGIAGGLLGEFAPETQKVGTEWVAASGTSGTVQEAGPERTFTISKLLRVPVRLKKLPADGIASNNLSVAFLAEFLVPLADRRTGEIRIPEGSTAICEGESINLETARFFAKCTEAETGGATSIPINLSLGSPDGSHGLAGAIISSRGYWLLGAWMTAFTASVLEGFTETVITPIDSNPNKAATDYITAGAAAGSTQIFSDITEVYLDRWKNEPFRISFGGDQALATLQQE
jgi:hypothetical protein